MTIEQNKATARRWSEELWSRGNLAVADEIIAPDYVRHDPGDPFPARGPEDVKRIVTMLRSMLADFSIHVDAMIAEGDMVVSRYTATATDTRGYMGMPPTGKVIHTPAIQIFRFAKGQIVESWAVRDDLGTLRQLGHLPAAGPARAPASGPGLDPAPDAPRLKVAGTAKCPDTDSTLDEPRYRLRGGIIGPVVRSNAGRTNNEAAARATVLATDTTPMDRRGG
jgi:steroid delta-isomerase-like uncharacterized protein